MQKLKINVDFARYKGKYVAIVDDNIVASGDNAEKVLDQARSKYPKKEVVLRKIPEEETMIFGTLQSRICQLASQA